MIGINYPLNVAFSINFHFKHTKQNAKLKTHLKLETFYHICNNKHSEALLLYILPCWIYHG